MLIVVVVAAAAVIPGASERRERAAAAAELVAALEVEAENLPAMVRVMGVRLERAADGSICLWRALDDGTIVGAWDHATRSHPHGGIFKAPIGECPAEEDREAFGFDGRR